MMGRRHRGHADDGRLRRHAVVVGGRMREGVGVRQEAGLADGGDRRHPGGNCEAETRRVFNQGTLAKANTKSINPSVKVNEAEKSNQSYTNT